MNYNEKEILENTLGKTDDDLPKSSICIELSTIEADLESNEKILNSIAVYSPLIDIQPRKGFVQVDLKFKNKIDSNLKKIWMCLEQYGKEVAKDRDVEDLSIPFLNLTIVPSKYNGHYFWVCTNPIFWTIQPDFPGEETNMIRLLFEADYIRLIETNEINKNEIEKDLERELSSRQYQEEQFALRQEEERAYQEERNKKIEELRRKK